MADPPGLELLIMPLLPLGVDCSVRPRQDSELNPQRPVSGLPPRPATRVVFSVLNLLGRGCLVGPLLLLLLVSPSGSL